MLPAFLERGRSWIVDQAVDQISIHNKTCRVFNARLGKAALPAVTGAELDIFIRGGHVGSIVP